MLTIDIHFTGRSFLGTRRYKVTITGNLGGTLTFYNLSNKRAFRAAARVAEQAIIASVPYRVTGSEIF